MKQQNLCVGCRTPAPSQIAGQYWHSKCYQNRKVKKAIFSKMATMPDPQARKVASGIRHLEQAIADFQDANAVKLDRDVELVARSTGTLLYYLRREGIQ